MKPRLPRPLRWSHPARLAVVSTAATGLVLAALFAGIVAFARANADRERRAELATALAGLVAPGDGAFDLAEFREAHPEMAAAVAPALPKAPDAPPAFQTKDHRLELRARTRGRDVAVSLDLRPAERRTSELAAILAALWLPLTLVVGGATWAAAQSVFRPLERLSAQALAMSGADLSARLVTPDRAEFGAFARDLNRMLDRIESTVRRGERFSADAAHEFRTPLALLRTRLETALLRPRAPEEYETAIRRSLAEIDRLAAITEALLRSARGEPEASPPAPTPLAPLVAEAVERWRDRFAATGVRLVADAAPLASPLLPDEARVLLDNLLDNALRYAPAGSRAVVLVEEAGGGVRLAVRDEGPGVPPELGDAIFDRFVRADEGRDRASGGAGIGLAVCRSLVASRGGRMALSSRPGAPTEIGAHFPKL